MLEDHRNRLEELLDATGDQNLRYDIGLWVLVRSSGTGAPPEFRAHLCQYTNHGMGEVDNAVVERSCKYLEKTRLAGIGALDSFPVDCS